MRDIDIEESLCDFIKCFGDDLYSLELLLFFARHPHARFNRSAVLGAPLSSGHLDTGMALKRLIDKKIVITHYQNGTTLYALTREEPSHSLAARLLSIDQSQWQRIITHLLNAQGIQ